MCSIEKYGGSRMGWLNTFENYWSERSMEEITFLFWLFGLMQNNNHKEMHWIKMNWLKDAWLLIGCHVAFELSL